MVPSGEAAPPLGATDFPRGQATEPPAGAPPLWMSLLDRFVGIVGEKAAVATFHFAAVQEGVDMGRAMQHESLERALQAAASRLGHEVQVDPAQDGSRIRLVGAAWPEAPVAAAIVRGLYEGVVRGHRGRRYVCERDDADPAGACMLRRKT